jgi:uncharacterized membrane-anchored protein
MRFPALTLAAVMASATPALAEPYKSVFPDRQPLANEKLQTILNGLDYKRGKVALPGASASLNLPKDFYFLDPADTEKVLVQLWGNPPGNAKGALGMVFPAKNTPVDDGSWGAVVRFDGSGRVNDEDASAIDYDKLLDNMKSATAEQNEERKKAGYQTIALVGWASTPFYDRAERKLHWARELEFGGETQHTVNYAVRALGREGVLEMNFVSGMDVLPAIKTAIPDVMKMIAFDEGKRYADWTPGDKEAAYGLAGLIGGAAAANLAAKFGFIAVALAFLKKGWILLAVGGVAGLRWLFGRFRRKPQDPPAGS